MNQTLVPLLGNATFYLKDFVDNPDYKVAYNYKHETSLLHMTSDYSFDFNSKLRIYEGAAAIFLTDDGQYGFKWYKSHKMLPIEERYQVLRYIHEVLPEHTPEVWGLINLTIHVNRTVFHEGPAIFLENIKAEKYFEWKEGKPDSLVENINWQVDELVNILKATGKLKCKSLSTPDREERWDQIEYNIFVKNNKPYLFDFSAISFI